MNTKLSGNEIQAFQDALLAAFPTAGDLRQMIRFQLNEKLYAIVGGGNQAELIFNLIEWAETEGRLNDLINGAVTSNPGNLKLQAWMMSYYELAAQDYQDVESSTLVEAVDAKLEQPSW